MKSRSINMPRKIIIAVAAVAVAAMGVYAAVRWAWVPNVYLISGGWFVLVSALLWWGNKFINSRFDKILPWKKWGNLRFFTLLIIGLFYLLIVINITYVLLKVTVTADPPTAGQIIVTNVIGAGIFIPLFSIYFSLHFLKHWRKSELEAERMQKENMRSQLNLLRTQLDPHFLFNNLNILSALIDYDTERSKEFVGKLADVYRALLKRQADDLVSLREEVDFLEAYVFLLKTRFGDFLQFTMNLGSVDKSRMIPPLTLQLLVENAIKHNTIDEKHPLQIDITPSGDHLVIKNSLFEKTNGNDATGTGLGNIRERYAYFTDEPVRIEKSATTFEVHVPLLTIENAS
jgi:sensor histidine kinase YesM